MTNDPSTPNAPLDPQALDLMIKQATLGLDEKEQAELEPACRLNPDELERIELAAAAFDLAMISRSSDLNAGETDSLPTSMPASLRSKLDADANEFFDRGRQVKAAIEAANEFSNEELDSSAPTRASATHATSSSSKNLAPHANGGIGPPVTRREVIAMAIAAACLLLVFTGLNPMTFNPNSDQTPSTSQRLVSFLKESPSDLIDLPFNPIHKASAGGRVVWSDKEQEGYMVLTGFAENDPTVSQYQLWIFDTDPAQKVPVDGGVFDFAKTEMNDAGEVIVPIKAHVPVKKAVQFAVTVEQPGGVMQSLREVIPVLAAIAD